MSENDEWVWDGLYRLHVDRIISQDYVGGLRKVTFELSNNNAKKGFFARLAGKVVSAFS